MTLSLNGGPEDRAQILEGVLDRLVFAADSSDFVVARLTVRGRREPVTVVGSLPRPHPGETLVLEGQWEFDKKFGEQFRFQNAQSRAPSTVAGIEKFLASSLIKGIGPEMARRITAKFGEQTLEVIESEPEELLKVPGIGSVRAGTISQAFREQKSIREVMLFLQTHGISTTFAYKIFRKYGNQAIDSVSRNPYCLATDIRGIGFRSADKIAGSMGIDMRSPMRAHAGILHVLDATQGEGHCFYPRGKLLEKARELLGIEAHALGKTLDQLVRSGEVVVEEDRVYPPVMARAENSVAVRLRNLIASPRFLPPIKMEAAVDWMQRRSGLILSTAQKQAIAEARSIKF